jgi:hypothetical protein
MEKVSAKSGTPVDSRRCPDLDVWFRRQRIPGCASGWLRQQFNLDSPYTIDDRFRPVDRNNVESWQKIRKTANLEKLIRFLLNRAESRRV